MKALWMLLLVVASLSVMGAAAVAGAGWGIFTTAYAGGQALARYDDGHKRMEAP